ncbi:hypothetical protein ES319_D11G325700v1 [Gossypium barbadense]|uniref:Uncharacterized protein n=1 Tax=Gossypium barbadense TaxID=3634 RepID=A0A5J5PHH4_GOSBA|nr:hypothetical protein ES319_D11G325700v1 [Gossypium barbadense]
MNTKNCGCMTCYKKWEEKLLGKNLLLNLENVADCGQKETFIMC